MAGITIDPSIEITEKSVTESHQITEASANRELDDFWIVNPATADSEMADVLHRTNTRGLIHLIVGTAASKKKDLEQLALFGNADKHFALKLAKKRISAAKKIASDEEEEIFFKKAETEYEEEMEYEQATKLAKKDYDGNGKIESPEKEHKGVVAKAIKKSKVTEMEGSCGGSHSENEETYTSKNLTTKDQKINIKKMVAMFKRINADVSGTGESQVPFKDVQYYTDQIKNIYELPTNKAKNLAIALSKHDDGLKKGKVTETCGGSHSENEEDDTMKCPECDGEKDDCPTCKGQGRVYVGDHSPVGGELQESMQTFNIKNYKTWEDDEDDPVNIASDKKKDKSHDKAAGDKDESPTQMKALDKPSMQDQSGGGDIDREHKVPANIIKQLKDQEDEAEKEASNQNVSNRDSAQFYKDLARAFKDLRTHLEGGTLRDLKQAQIFATSLMGPMLHKIPADVMNYIAKGGQQRSLKSYMSKVDSKYPITGPRNQIK